MAEHDDIESMDDDAENDSLEEECKNKSDDVGCGSGSAGQNRGKGDH